MKQETTSSAKQYLPALIWCALAVLADQFTKWLAVTFLKDQEPFVLIPGVFELRYLENRGAAFGIFQGKQYLFLIGGVLVLLLIGYIYGKIPAKKRFRLLRLCTVLVVSGAVGNMIDRMVQNYVVDFFYFSLIDFPIFNVADCYVVIGCFLFAFLIFFYYKDEELDFIFPVKENKQKKN